MARVVVSGYYGYGNAGDELILTALRHALSGHEVTVLSADPARTTRDHGVAAVPRANPLAITRALARADLLVSGGGGLLQDATGPATVPYYLGVIALARALGKPFVIYAQGVGPLRRAWSRSALRVVRWAAGVTVRDAASAELLRDAGVAQVEVTGDPVLTLPRPLRTRVPPAELAALGIRDGDTVLAVAPRGSAAVAASAHLAAAADALAGRHGARVVLVPMQTPQDVHACQDVAAHMRTPAAILPGPLPPDRYPQVFAGFHAVVAVRLHALILGALARVPVVGLGYDPKIRAFLQSLGYADHALSLRAPAESIVARLEGAFPAGPAETAAIDVAVQRLAQAAHRNDEVVLGVLEGMRGDRGTTEPSRRPPLPGSPEVGCRHT